MVKLVTLYRRVDDEERLEAFFTGVHLPLAETLTGLRASEVIRIEGKPNGQSRFHLSYALTFDSRDALLAALASPAGVHLLQTLAPWIEAGVITWYFGDAWADEHHPELEQDTSG